MVGTAHTTKLKQASEHYLAGRLDAAEQIYHHILEEDPAQHEANFGLGLIWMYRQKPDRAIPYLKSALEADLGQRDYWIAYAEALRLSGQASAAQQLLALGIENGLSGGDVQDLARQLEEELGGIASADASTLNERQSSDRQTPKHRTRRPKHKDLSTRHQATTAEKRQLVSLAKSGKLDAFERLAKELIARYPRDPYTYKQLGSILAQQQRSEESLTALRGALALNPNDHEIINAIGFVLVDLGKLQEAVLSYQQAIAIKPNFPEAHFNLGIALRDLGKLPEAEASYREALRLKPSYPKAYNNLGVALMEQGLLEDAVSAYRKAISLEPSHAKAHNNLGNALNRLGRSTEAEPSYRQAISLDPRYADALANLGATLKDLGRLDEAEQTFRSALKLNPSDANIFSNLIFSLAYTGRMSPDEVKRTAQGWEQAVLTETERASARTQQFAHRVRRGRALRIGILSAELGQHAVAYFLLPWLRALSPERITPLLYSTRPRFESQIEAFNALGVPLVSLVGMTDADAAARIRSDGVDVLLDTSGHTSHNRLGIIARRAAPVQCHYIGYFGTTGLSEMDYFIGDNKLTPPALDAAFTERVWRLPRPWLAYAPLENAPSPDWQGGDDILWLGSFNNLTKVREESLQLWARVLIALPQACLLLKDAKAEDVSTQTRIRTTLKHAGVNPERVYFAPRVASWSEHMARYNQIDIALDTIPLNSGTTGFDALWMGVPLVTLAGDWMGGRMGAAILSGIGRAEWIAHDEEEYVAKVVALAQDVETRRALRTSQREQMRRSPLCDGVGLARALEKTFEQMFDHWWEQETTPCYNGSSGEQDQSPSLPSSHRNVLSTPDGATLVYSTIKAGHRDTLVLLHGALCEAASLRHLSDVCARHADLILPDLRGHGESRAGADAWTLDRLARDVIAIAEAQKARSLILIGESFGALVAAQIACLIQDRVRLVVCCEPPLSPARLSAVRGAIIRAQMGPAAETAKGLASILGYGRDATASSQATRFHDLINALPVPNIVVHGTAGHGALATVLDGSDLTRLRGASLIGIESVPGADQLVLRKQGCALIPRWLTLAREDIRALKSG